MKLIKWAVEKPVTVCMVFLAVIIISLFAFRGLTIDLFPNINIPMGMVNVTYAGAGPAEVENTVTKPLESVLGGVQGVSEVLSTSSTGSSLIMLNFAQDTDMNFATLQMRERVDLVKDSLPDDVENIMVLKMDPSMIPVSQVAVSGDYNLQELTELTENTIVPRIERIPGVASVSLVGAYKRVINVVVDPNRLASYGLTTTNVANVIAMDNIDYSVGTVVEGSNDISVSVSGQYTSLDQLRKLIIPLPSGGVIRLSDVASVQDTTETQTQISRMNGQACVSFTVNKQSDANTVEVAQKVDAELVAISQETVGDISLKSVFSQADYIQVVIDSLVGNVLIGALFAILILLLFLRNIKLTLIVAASIPIALFGAFSLLFFSGKTLNIMTLGGLALGVGMMVDSSIVILEGIFRYREKGFSPKEAAVLGASELSMAVIASTLTTIAVFIPIIFTDGLASMFFGDFSLTVLFTLIASLVVALTLVPMLCSRIAPSQKKSVFVDQGKSVLGKFGAFYGKLLNLALKRRKLTVLIVVVCLVASLMAVPFVGMELMPTSDNSQITMTVSMDNGTFLERTDKAVQQMEGIIKETVPEQQSIYTNIAAGGIFGQAGSSDSASITLVLCPTDERERSAMAIADELRRDLLVVGGADVSISSGESVSMTAESSDLSYSILGDDPLTLADISQQVKDILLSVEGTREVTTSLDNSRPELKIQINRDKASMYGLSVATAAQAVRSAFLGDTASIYRENGEEVYIKLVLPEAMRQSTQDLQRLLISTPSGARVPISEIGDLVVVDAPAQINRENNSRVVTVSAMVEGVSLDTVSQQVQDKLDQLVLPQGYLISTGGAVQDMMDSFSDLFLALLLAIVLVYMIMASLFESLVKPFIVMFSLPTMFIGVVLALLLTGSTLNVSSFIGLIMLAGIVVNNAIVMVDYTNQLMNKGMDVMSAVKMASAVRLRPILMTALTTVLAMVPVAFFAGDGSEFSAPMAVALIGGLVVSTIFTLVFIPVIYSLVQDSTDKRKAKKELRKKRKENRCAKRALNRGGL